MSNDEPYRIRLRKPWQVERLPDGLRWRRTFHRPTGLGAAERVWIAVEGTDATGSVALNDQPLGPLAGRGSPSRFEVTGLLRGRNELVLVIDLTPQGGETVPSCPPGEVGIEIWPDEG